jgi:hypothetical protein
MPSSQIPTEAMPERGRVTAFGQVVSEAEHWIEDGIHVLRSSEFDLIAGDPDFIITLNIFGEKTEDLFWYLSERDSLTDNENETFLLLAPRFMGIFQELERREAARHKRVLSINWPRRSTQTRDWLPESTRKTSSQPSLA